MPLPPTLRPPVPIPRKVLHHALDAADVPVLDGYVAEIVRNASPLEDPSRIVLVLGDVWGWKCAARSIKLLLNNRLAAIFPDSK